MREPDIFELLANADDDQIFKAISIHYEIDLEKINKIAENFYITYKGNTSFPPYDSPLNRSIPEISEDLNIPEKVILYLQKKEKFSEKISWLEFLFLRMLRRILDDLDAMVLLLDLLPPEKKSTLLRRVPKTEELEKDWEKFLYLLFRERYLGCSSLNAPLKRENIETILNRHFSLEITDDLYLRVIKIRTMVSNDLHKAQKKKKDKNSEDIILRRGIAPQERQELKQLFNKMDQ